MKEEGKGRIHGTLYEMKLGEGEGEAGIFNQSI